MIMLASSSSASFDSKSILLVPFISSEQPSGGYPDQVEQEGRITRYRDAEFLQLTQGFHDDLEQGPQVILDQPVEPRGWTTGLLQDEFVQRRLAVRIAHVGADERLGASPGLVFRDVRRRLDQRNIEFMKNPVGGSPP